MVSTKKNVGPTMDLITKFEIFKVYRDRREMELEHAMRESLSYFPDCISSEFSAIRNDLIRAIHKMDLFFINHLQLDENGEPDEELLNNFISLGYSWSDVIDSQETASTEDSSDNSMADFIVDDYVIDYDMSDEDSSSCDE